MDTRLTDFDRHMREVRRMQPGSAFFYLDTMKRFDEWRGGLGDLDAVTASEIEQFMARPRRGGKLGKPATQDRDRAAMKAFWKWACTHGVASTDPTVDVAAPKVRNRQPKAVSDDLWSKLWAAQMADFDRAWLGLMCFAGLRRLELVQLRPTQVDFRRQLLLSLVRKGGDTDAVEYGQMSLIVADGLPEVLPDPQRFLECVAQAAEDRRGERTFVAFNTGLTQTDHHKQRFELDDDVSSPQAVNRALESLLGRASLPRNAFTPHALRHTCVTNLLRVGVPIEVVADAVGHSNIDTTRRYVKSAGRLAEWRSRLTR